MEDEEDEEEDEQKEKKLRWKIRQKRGMKMSKIDLKKKIKNEK